MAGILSQGWRAPRPGRYLILLAAGSSRRLARPKMLLRLRGERLVRRQARKALAAQPAGCLVVTGAEHARVVAALRGLPLGIVRNRGYRSGQAASIAAGVRALPRSASHVLILAVDQWALSGTALARLLARAARRPLAAEYAGVLGIPVVFPRSDFPRLCRLTGAAGARTLIEPGAVDRFPLPEAAFDLDTAAEARAARRAALRERR
jgi:molybdenum cofactor cytidylyltransferase